MSREEIEKLLAERIGSGEMRPGLFSTGLQWVAVARSGERLVFQWFEDMTPIEDVVTVY